MKLTKLSNLFEIKYGVNLELVNLDELPSLSSDSVCFVSRTESNNGVSSFVKKQDGVVPIPANTLTVAAGGSVLSTFLQPYSYYSGRDLYVLTPKKSMTESELIYYSICLKRNKYKYNYGRQANKTLKDILVPDNVPEKFRTLKVKSLNTRSFSDDSTKKVKLNSKDWKSFKLGNLFSFEKGERLTKLDRITGETPLITAGENSNGVSEYISYEDFKGNKKIFENKITVDMFFNVFYHDYRYFSDDNVHTLIPISFDLNRYNSLFLVTILIKLKYKYAYGRQVRLMRLPSEEIKLPVDKKGQPDWKFMEDYIKSLPYSSSI